MTTVPSLAVAGRAAPIPKTFSARVVPLLALLASVALTAGCAGRALPPDELATPVTLEALRRTQELYLYPERLDERMVVGALDALEERFDSVRFEHAEGEGQLTVGDATVDVPVPPGFDRERYRQVLARSLHFVSQHLDEEMEPDETLELVSLRGALNALDRYSTVFSGRGTDDFRIRFSGKLRGIGSQIGRRDGDLIAIKVFPKSPAEKGGLKDGDAIISIDGDPTRPLSVRDAVDRIRGPADTKVFLGVKRGEDKHVLEITRGEVQIPSVESRMLAPRIGYVRVFQVARTTAMEFRTKTLELGPLDGLVFDLRGNTGGSMQAAARLADLFLSRQLIMRVVNRDGEPASQRSRTIAGAEVLFPFSVVILVDPSTASAAEIISGALSPRADVTIVGQTTFGKGLIQQVLPLPDENLLKLTVAEYVLSNDRAIHGKGIVPDIELYPVSDKNLSGLADVPRDAIPYVRVSGEDDTFPIDFGQRLLQEGAEAAIVTTLEETSQKIAKKLVPFGVTWDQASSDLPSELGADLEIESQAQQLEAGRPATVRVTVRNPNPFPIPDAWAALSGSADYLANRIVSLGTLPANGSAEGLFELTPPDGLSALDHPVKVLVASGDRPVGSQQIVLAVAAHSPRVQIDVERVAADEVKVLLTNVGPHPTGPLRVGVPGAMRAFEDLAPGAVEELSLPLVANPDELAVTFSGPYALRRVGIPIPDTRVTVVPPDVELGRGGLPGLPQFQLRANAPEGLREAWIRMDGQKSAYVAWNGRQDGSLNSPLGEGGHDVTVKVETTTGVSILDARRLSPH